jgi:glycosyltransferase involved in cell wall biosynthesis
MPLPFISVVVTCYNYEQYVAEAIRSALNQSYARREVVVVNDGSTDGSLEVLRGFGDQIKLIDQKNAGHVSACDTGFRASRGDVVIFLDADDVLAPDALARVGEAWSEDCAKVQFDLRIIDADGTDLGRRFSYFPKGYDAEKVRKDFERTGTYRWPVTVGNAYSRKLVESVFPLTRHGPDGALNTVAPLYGSVHTIREPLASYRLHGANAWSSAGSDAYRLPERIKHRKLELQDLREHARKLGVALPPGDPLDAELAFINYRLVAWRLGLDYPGKEYDRPGRLLRKAIGTTLSQRFPHRVAFAHVVWFGALYIAPRPLARLLFHARFNRAQWRSRVKRTLDGWRHVPRRVSSAVRG